MTSEKVHDAAKSNQAEVQQEIVDNKASAETSDCAPSESKVPMETKDIIKQEEKLPSADTLGAGGADVAHVTKSDKPLAANAIAEGLLKLQARLGEIVVGGLSALDTF